jgi:hypothetical protein
MVFVPIVETAADSVATVDGAEPAAEGREWLVVAENANFNGTAVKLRTNPSRRALSYRRAIASVCDWWGGGTVFDAAVKKCQHSSKQPVEDWLADVVPDDSPPATQTVLPPATQAGDHASAGTACATCGACATLYDDPTAEDGTAGVGHCAACWAPPNGPGRCPLCGVDLPSASDAARHLAGKRHRRARNGYGKVALEEARRAERGVAAAGKGKKA